MLVPGSVTSLRVDVEARAFADDDDTPALHARVADGTLSLVDYDTTVAADRLRAHTARTRGEAIDGATADLGEAFRFLWTQPRRAYASARRAQITLTGVPVRSFASLSAWIQERAERLSRAREREQWLELAEWVLPRIVTSAEDDEEEDELEEQEEEEMCVYHFGIDGERRGPIPLRTLPLEVPAKQLRHVYVRIVANGVRVGFVLMVGGISLVGRGVHRWSNGD